MFVNTRLLDRCPSVVTAHVVVDTRSHPSVITIAPSAGPAATPAALLHRRLDVDCHTLDVAWLRPNPRVMTDQSQLPVVPDPTIVTSELPVVGSLLLTTLLLLACTNVHPAFTVPSCPLASTVLTKLSDHPPPLLLFDATALSDLHVIPCDPVLAVRTRDVRSTCDPMPDPSTVTVALPVVGPLLAIPLLGVGALYVHTPVPVPICTPTLTCTSAVHAVRPALPPATIPRTDESDVHIDPSLFVPPICTTPVLSDRAIVLAPTIDTLMLPVEAPLHGTTLLLDGAS